MTTQTNERATWPWLLALLLLSLSIFPSTSKAVDLMACTGTETDTYSPGIRLFPQNVQVSFSDNFGPNSCIAGDGSGITSVSTPGGVYVTQRSCLEVLSFNPVGGSMPLTWNNGDVTVFSWEATDVQHENLVGTQIYTITADVSAGRYQGRQMIFVITLVKPNPLECLAPGGITSVSGPVSFVIL